MEEKEEIPSTNKRKRKFQRICVFCGSRAGSKGIYGDAALELGKAMVAREINLVYGGGSVGLMGIISKTVFQGGRHVLGVLPRPLLPHEVVGETFGEVKIVADMHQRKAEMEKNANAFIALPGGYGTMEELLEVIAWSQLGIHDKPVGLLNVGGYFNSLLTFFDKAVEEGFLDGSERRIVILADSAEELLTKMEEYSPRHDRVAPRQRQQTDQSLDERQTE